MPFGLNRMLQLQKFDFLDLIMRLIQNGLNPVTPVVKYHGDIGGNRVKPNCLPNLPRVFRYPCACSSNDRMESSKKKCLASQDLLFFSKKKVGHALKIASFCHDTGGYGADYFYCNNTMKQVVPVLFLY